MNIKLSSEQTKMIMDTLFEKWVALDNVNDKRAKDYDELLTALMESYDEERQRENSDTVFVLKYFGGFCNGEILGEFDSIEEAQEARYDLIDEDLRVDGYADHDYIIEKVVR